ncbi:hypothetical protein LTR27_003818 [Elasticomyces elasticus]|nr:hypothetical protein LTR27_003818 [Elasticomyces elasticus]
MDSEGPTIKSEFEENGGGGVTTAWPYAEGATIDLTDDDVDEMSLGMPMLEDEDDEEDLTLPLPLTRAARQPNNNRNFTDRTPESSLFRTMPDVDFYQHELNILTAMTALEILVAAKDYNIKFCSILTFGEPWYNQFNQLQHILQPLLPAISTLPHFHIDLHLGHFGKPSQKTSLRVTQSTATNAFKELASQLSARQIFGDAAPPRLIYDWLFSKLEKVCSILPYEHDMLEGRVAQQNPLATFERLTGIDSSRGGLEGARIQKRKTDSEDQPKKKPKADGRDRTPAALIAAGKMSDKARDEDPQIDDRQAIAIIKDHSIQKFLRNKHGPNYFNKKGLLYQDVHHVINMRGPDGNFLLSEQQRKSAIDVSKVKLDQIGDESWKATLTKKGKPRQRMLSRLMQ